MSSVRRARREWKERLRSAASTLTGPPKGSTTLSVVIVGRGKCESLDACVSSVLASSHGDLDVILVPDHDDRDAEAAIRDRTASETRVRTLVSPTGRSDLDRAVDQAEGSYLAFVDADDTVPPGAYEQLLKVLEETGSDFALGQQFRQESGSFREVPWSAGLLTGRRLRAKASDVPEAIVDSGHGNRVLSAEFWRGAGLRFGNAGLRSAPSVITEAFLRCRTFDVVPERVYDECVRDRSRPLAEQRRYQSTDLGDRLGALRTSAAMVEAHLSSDAYASWLVTVLDRVVPPLYFDSVVADEDFFGLLSKDVRELIGSAPPGLLESVPVQSRVSAWLAANSDATDLAQMADFLADNPHGLPIQPEHQVMIPSAVKAEVPGWVREVRPVDLKPRTRLTRLAVFGSTVEIDGAAFFEYGQDSPPHVELVNAEAGVRRSTQTAMRRDPGINRWAARAWEDHSQAGFTTRVDFDDLVADMRRPSSWRVEISLSGCEGQSGLPLQTRDAGVLETVQTHLLERGSVSACWESVRGLMLTLDPTGPSPDDLRRPDTEDSVGLFVEAATMAADGLCVSGRSLRSGRTRWRLFGARGVGIPTESTAEGGRFTATLNLTHTEWGREETPLRTGRYRVEVSGADGSDMPLRWTDKATGVGTDLITDRVRVEVHPRGGGADLVLLPPVPSHARGVYAQNQLRTARYVSARERERSDAVLFESFRGVSVGDNPGAICAEMLRRRLDLDLAWVVDDSSVIAPDGTRAVARRSPEWYDLLATARGYISNAAAPYFFRKRSDQFHLQTWHGTPLKRIGEDRPADGFDMWRHDRHMRSQSSDWDALVSPSPYCSARFRSAFHYDGTMLEAGYPRNDVLLGDDAASRRARVRAALGVGQLGVDQPERVLLYAPTWRDYAGARESKPLYLDADLVTASSTDTVILVRGHYNGTSDADAYPGKPRILDVTRYPDIADLYLAADVLVTDYSSVMFDFALTDKPMILLVPDLERYRDVERGFYFDIEDQTPGPMLRSTEEVIEALDEPDGFAAVRDRFRRTFCPHDDGLASARVVDHLLARW